MPGTTAVRPWTDLPARHQPQWPDPRALQAVLRKLETAAAVTSPHQINGCRDLMGRVATGQAMAFMMGDCAETFKPGLQLERYIASQLTLLVELSLIFQYAFGLPVVRFLRQATFHKPRSRPTEIIDDTTYTSYLGDGINGLNPEHRSPNPDRLLQAHLQAVASHHIVHNLAASGALSLDRLDQWSQLFASPGPYGDRYRELVDVIRRSISFMQACGVTTASPNLAVPQINFSREALFLDWEEALTRIDPATGHRFNATTELVWIGARTNHPEEAHVAYAASIVNPLGVKIGPDNTPDQISQLIDILSPEDTPGRLTFIFRLGRSRIEELLPPLLAAVASSGRPVALLTDPMHGNTFETRDGIKTRDFETIMAEIELFYAITSGLGASAGGIHVEATPDNVAECLGGPDDITPASLPGALTCDPRMGSGHLLELTYRLIRDHHTTANESAR